MTNTELLLFDGNHVRHYYDPRPGDIIYHYTTVGAAKAILDAQKIWLSEYEKTNDESEFKFAKEKFATAINRLSDSYTDESIAVYHERLKAFEERQCMMLGSFTESKDDLTQWERYADRSTGCVIGLNAYWFWKYPGIRMHRVIYDQEFLDNLVEANLYIMDDVRKRLKQIPSELLGSQFVFEQFCFKDPRFSSENEIRITRSVLKNPASLSGLDDSFMKELKIKFPGPFAKPFEINVRDGPYGATRYIELPISFEGRSAVRSVGFGPRCEKADELEVRTACKGLRGVSYWRSDIPLR